jgi:hypothetical protein
MNVVFRARRAAASSRRPRNAFRLTESIRHQRVGYVSKSLQSTADTVETEEADSDSDPSSNVDLNDHERDRRHSTIITYYIAGTENVS